MATGDLIKLGTLHLNNVKKANNATHAYPAGQTIEIKDTDSVDVNKVQWIEINENGITYLVANRNLLNSISWNDLNAQDLIFGKEINIDGKTYIVRLLTGGNVAGDSGGKLPNEWDRWIGNSDSLEGLNDSNALWNWRSIYSWCQETYLSGGTNRVHRGDASARYWHYRPATSHSSYVGWRPVLELLDTAPNISGTDEDLGSKTKNFGLKYQVDDPGLENIITIKESLNGEEIKTITPATRNEDYTISINVYDLPIGKHTVTIQATNDVGGDNTRTYTFTRASLKKFLIQSEESALTINSLGELEVIKETKPLKEDFLEHGFENNKLTSFDLSKLSALVKPKLLIYSEEIDPELNLKAIPKPQLIKPTDDIKFKMLSKINTMTLTSNKTGGGIVKIIFSVDSGVTWGTYNSEALAFEDVETIDIKNIKEKGIDADTFNLLNEKWNEVIKEGKIRFAYYLEIENEDDVANVDKLEINMDLTGKWKKAIHGTDYDYEYDNEHIYVTFDTDGSYKVNYVE